MDVVGPKRSTNTMSTISTESTSGEAAPQSSVSASLHPLGRPSAAPASAPSRDSKASSADATPGATAPGGAGASARDQRGRVLELLTELAKRPVPPLVLATLLQQVGAARPEHVRGLLDVRLVWALLNLACDPREPERGWADAIAAPGGDGEARLSARAMRIAARPILTGGGALP